MIQFLFFFPGIHQDDEEVFKIHTIQRINVWYAHILDAMNPKE